MMVMAEGTEDTCHLTELFHNTNMLAVRIFRTMLNYEVQKAAIIVAKSRLPC